MVAIFFYYVIFVLYELPINVTSQSPLTSLVPLGAARTVRELSHRETIYLCGGLGVHKTPIDV